MPDPQVITQANAFRAALLNREATQMRAMTARWLTVERTLEDSIAESLRQIAELRKAGKTFGRNPAPYLKLERYQELLRQTRGELSKFAQYAEGNITSSIADHARLGVEQSNAQIAMAAADYPTVAAGFNRMSVPAVENMTALLQEGAPVGELLRQAFPDAAVRMTDALVTGTALGWNPRKTARAMAQGLQDGALQRAMVIARTEQLRSLRTAQLTAYRESKVVKQWMRIASKSSRTCLACLIEDGTVYELETAFDEHPQGRCMCVPVLAGREPPTFTRGREWFETRPPALQKQIMGIGAWNAWKDGAVTLDGLVARHEHPVWGASLGQRALRDVVGAEQARAYSTGLGKLAPKPKPTPVPAPAPAPAPAQLESERQRGRLQPKELSAAEINRALELYGRNEMNPGRLDFPEEVVINQKIINSQNLAQHAGVTAEEASQVIRSWADTSNDNDLRSLAYQEEAAKYFGVPLSKWQNGNLQEVMARRLEGSEFRLGFDELLQLPYEFSPFSDLAFGTRQRSAEEARDLTRKTVEVTYQETQKQLAADGITEMRLYRGISLNKKDVANMSVDTSIAITGNTLESWSLQRDVAARFATGRNAIILETVVPVDRIYSTARTGIGCLGEWEVVVIGGLEDTAKLVAVKK